MSCAAMKDSSLLDWMFDGWEVGAADNHGRLECTLVKSAKQMCGRFHS